ncbi:hypothetical protein B0J13DRAFT_531109 [Dactylonectria estremocensis]|uniref:DUF676 domain-containing protein n=1 Tax=Dactylonectria estremocensis TaxID=1079267 RepID=A0A9P9DQF5_9HYPO|nr:hypothetical protein B0J13DRAFT_531109 [Dactylonectria estremocensis]
MSRDDTPGRPAGPENERVGSFETSEASQETQRAGGRPYPSHQIWRVRGIPTGFDNEKLANILLHHPDLQHRSSDMPDDGINSDGAGGILVYTLAPDLCRDQVATACFRRLPYRLRTLARDDQVTIDVHLSPKTTRIGVKRRRNLLPPLRLATDQYFHGITVLFSPTGSNRSVDGLAVPGLGGHPFGSFVHKGDRHMCLSDSLPQDMPATRVMIYGYGSELQDSTHFAELDDLARSLHLDIRRWLQPGDQKLLVFIGHSLSGLLIKEILVRVTKSDSEADLGNEAKLPFLIARKGTFAVTTGVDRSRNNDFGGKCTGDALPMRRTAKLPDPQLGYGFSFGLISVSSITNPAGIVHRMKASRS